jgi:hypothetical protein
VVSFTTLPLYPEERAPGTRWIAGWVGPRASLEDLEKREFLPLPELELDISVVQPVASRYTDCAIPAPNNNNNNLVKFFIYLRADLNSEWPNYRVRMNTNSSNMTAQDRTNKK